MGNTQSKEREVEESVVRPLEVQVGGAVPLQTGVATVANPYPLPNLGSPRPTTCEPIESEFCKSHCEWVPGDPMYVQSMGGKAFERPPGLRRNSSAVGPGTCSDEMTDCHAMTDNMVPAKVAVRGATGALSPDGSDRGATKGEESNRGSVTGWDSDAQGQWWDDGSEAMWEDPNHFSDVQAMWEQRLAVVGEGADIFQGPDEDKRIVFGGYKKALSYAREAASDADSETTCVVLKSLLRSVHMSLGRADEHVFHAAAALLRIEEAVGLAEVEILATMKFAECRVRDLVAWRAQLCAPVTDNAMYLKALRTAWECLGLTLSDRSLAKILHAHQQEIARVIPWCFPSETQTQTRAR